MSFDIRDDGFDPSADPWWDPATRDWAMWYQIEIYASEDLYDRRECGFEDWQLRWEDTDKFIRKTINSCKHDFINRDKLHHEISTAFWQLNKHNKPNKLSTP